MRYPYYIGRGCEGEVYRISKTKVKKIWTGNLFGGYSVKALRYRFLAVEKQIKKLPEPLRNVCTVPRFYGIRRLKTGEIVSYHEFIGKGRRPRNVRINRLESYFVDVWTGKNPNVICSKGKIYLVDVGVGS